MQNTLLLNASFEPLRIISWQRAFVLAFQGKVEILEEYQANVRTVTREYRVPAVIRLRRWVKLARKTPMIRFSRANVYARDEYCCQYCYNRFPERDLTLDHVKPVVQGGRKTWDNIVTACVRCNQKKSDREPTEVGLRLLKRPVTPSWLPGLSGSVRIKAAPDVWRPYLGETANEYEEVGANS